MAVLHIVLMILKFIGILLLILLGIFLLTVLGVLFCPVRYSAQGYKDENKYGGKAKVFWLCHLVSFSVWYDSSQGEAGYGVRIFGIPLLKVLEELSKRKEKKKKKAKAAKVQGNSQTTEQHTIQRKGITGSRTPWEIAQSYRNSIINIDVQVINALKDLFMMIY